MNINDYSEHEWAMPTLYTVLLRIRFPNMMNIKISKKNPPASYHTIQSLHP